MDNRERILALHENIHGGENAPTKDDIELILDMIEVLYDKLEQSKDHSHRIY